MGRSDGITADFQQIAVRVAQIDQFYYAPIARHPALHIKNPFFHLAHGSDSLMIDKLTLAPVERGNGIFICRIQAEIKNIEIFRHTFHLAGFGERDNIIFHQPAQNDLRHRFAILRTNLRQYRMPENIVFSFGKRRPGFDDHAFCLQGGDLLPPLVERIDFNLVCLRHDLIERPQIHGAIGGEIADANSANFARRLRFFQRTPTAVNIAVGLVNQYNRD